MMVLALTQQWYGHVFAGGSKDGDSLWLQEMFGSFLSLNMMPPAHQVSEALLQAQKAAAGLTQGSTGVPRDMMMPVLQMLLPEVPLCTVALLAPLL